MAPAEPGERISFGDAHLDAGHPAPAPGVGPDRHQPVGAALQSPQRQQDRQGRADRGGAHDDVALLPVQDALFAIVEPYKGAQFLGEPPVHPTTQPRVDRGDHHGRDADAEAGPQTGRLTDGKLPVGPDRRVVVAGGRDGERAGHASQARRQVTWR